MKVLVLALALTTLCGASSESISSPLQRASLVEKVEGLLTLGVSNDKSRRLQTDDTDLFSSYCQLIESTGQFDCDCNEFTNTATCTSDTLCDGDTCAVFETGTDFDNSFQLQSIKICVNYHSDPDSTDYRDGCVVLTYANDGDTVTKCEIQFEVFLNQMDTCKQCEICTTSDGKQGYLIDCSNIEDHASSDGCVLIDNSQGGFFPGFRMKDPDSEAFTVGTLVAILGAILALAMF